MPADAWNALAGIYINEQRYTQALYCLEEVLLHQPGNPRALLRYAEVNYTCGTTEAFAVAAKYFARWALVLAVSVPDSTSL